MSAAIHETIDVEVPVGTAFRYVADFGNLDEWDPTFDRAERTDDGEVLGVGSTFRVESDVAGSTITIDYRIAEYEPDRMVRLVGTSDRFTSDDRIEFAPTDDGTRIDYHAEVDTDLPDWVDALGTPVFKLVGTLGAARGLEDRLGD